MPCKDLFSHSIGLRLVQYVAAIGFGDTALSGNLVCKFLCFSNSSSSFAIRSGSQPGEHDSSKLFTDISECISYFIQCYDTVYAKVEGKHPTVITVTEDEVKAKQLELEKNNNDGCVSYRRTRDSSLVFRVRKKRALHTYARFSLIVFQYLSIICQR